MGFNVISFIAYQALWFAVVIGAAHGYSWSVVVLAAAFVAWQLYAAADRNAALRLIGSSILCGLCVDGGAAASGWVAYAAHSPAWPPGGAPLWILGLWASFGVTVAGPFRWIAGRPVLGAILGAAGGPLSYLGAARGWGTVRFTAPAWHGLVYLAAAWAIALAVLAIVGKGRPLRGAPTVEGSSQRRVD